MSILTWQQVTAPDFSTAQRATERAQELILGGIESAKQIPADIAATQQTVDGIEQKFAKQEMAQFVNNMTSPEQIQGFIDRGLLDGRFGPGAKVRSSMITPDMIAEVAKKKQSLTDERDNRAEADLVKQGLKVAPDSLSAATDIYAKGDWRDPDGLIKAALAANTLSQGKTQMLAAQAKAAGRGKGKNDDDDKPAKWADAMLKQWVWDKDAITATQKYGSMSPEEQLEIDKALKKQGESAAFLAPFLLGGQDPGSIKKNYTAAARTQQFFRRQGDVQNEVIAQTGKPPPGYDINGAFVRTPTMGEVFDYDNTDVRQMSVKMNLPDSGASGPWQLTPRTRAKAGEALWPGKWRGMLQTIEHEKKMAEWVWNNEGADAWEQSLGGFVNAIQAAEGIAPEKRKTPTQYFKEPKNKRSFEDMATFLTTVETGYLPNNFADKTKALEEYIAKKESQYTRGVEAIITSSANKSENMVDAAARVTAKLGELKAEGIVSTKVLEFMENLEGHAEAKGIDASAGELADLVLHAVETQGWGSWEDVAKDFNFAEGKALTRLSALPTARENLRKLAGDKENLLEAKAETLKWDEGKSKAEIALSGVRTNPKKFRSLHREFFDVGAASERLEKIFTRPGADQTRLPTSQELGMPAGGSAPAPALQSLPEDEGALQSQESAQSVDANISQVLATKPPTKIFAPKSEKELKEDQDLATQVEKERAELERLETANTSGRVTPEIIRRRERVFDLQQKRSTNAFLGLFSRAWRDNESKEVQRARDAFNRYAEANVSRSKPVTPEEFAPIYAAQLKKEAEDLAEGKAKKAAEAEAKAAEKAAKEAARIEEARKAEQQLLEDARRAAQAGEKTEARVKPANDQRRKQSEAVDRLLPSWLK